MAGRHSFASSELFHAARIFELILRISELLSGRDGGALAKEADLAITIASSNTARIQECHIGIGHLLCELTDEGLE